MGISMRVLAVTDDDIRASLADPALVVSLRRSRESRPLWNAWARLDYLLGEGRGSPISRGDVVIEGAPDDTHAIYSHSAKTFAESLRGLSEATARARFDSGFVDKLGPTGVSRLYADRTFQELWSYFAPLRELVEQAAAGGKGLMFAQYEDY